VVIAKGNHFPMCDAPDFVAHTIHHWYRECVVTARTESFLERRETTSPET
jgi:hypothetical protein